MSRRIGFVITGMTLVAWAVLATACCCPTCGPVSDVFATVQAGMESGEIEIPGGDVWPTVDAEVPQPTVVIELPRGDDEQTLVQRGSVAVGLTVQAELASDSTVDVWTLTTGGEFLVIDVIADNNSWDPVLYVYDNRGVQVAYDDDSGAWLNPRLNTMLPAGTYELHVQAFSRSGGYTLSVNQVERDSRPITYGATVEGRLTSSVRGEWWHFEGRAGDVVTISMVGREDFRDTYLELHGPDGSLVTYDDDGGEGFFALIRNFRLPDSGTYYILARAWGSDTGPYDLTLSSQ